MLPQTPRKTARCPSVISGPSTRKSAASRVHRQSRCRAATGPYTTLANSEPPPPRGPGDNGGGGWEESGGEGGAGEIGVMLAAAGRTLESLPGDMQAGLSTGTLTKTAVARYMQLDSNWFTKIFMPFQGFRERLMADPSFFVKIGIECGIGICTKGAAEYEKRKGRFSQELDFVTANVIMAIIADFMLVWLPAPTMCFTTANSCRTPRNALERFFSCCPDNAFQKVPENFPPWSFTQRLAAPIRNGGKLLVVGFCASMFGVLITNALIGVRSMVSGPTAQDKKAAKAQNPLTVSSAYATYMATSSNMRYQVVAGVLEERGIEALFAGKTSLCHALSLVLRTANTFLGSLMWVDFVRLIGLQPKAENDKAK